MTRKYQNGYSARLSYSIILEGTYQPIVAKGVSCSHTKVRLFMEYYNHTLSDYLSALRSNKLMLLV